MGVLYVRIKESNKDFLAAQARKLGYKSVAQFLDARIDEWKRRAKGK